MGKNAANPLAADLDYVLARTGPLWEELRGQRLFLTGGTGFIGCWLLESLLWANDKLGLDVHATVLTRNPEAFRVKAPHLVDHSGVSILVGDMKNFALPAESFAYVVHAATQPPANNSAAALAITFESIIEGSRRALELARRCAARGFLLTSSGAIYGPQPQSMPRMQEDHPGGPLPANCASAYAEGKRAAETLCALYAGSYGLPVKIARCFAFVGPYLPLQGAFAVGNFMGNALQGEAIQIKGDGTPIRSYLYAADMAIWLWRILLKGDSCRPYNVGSEDEVSIADVARAVGDCLSPPLSVAISGVAMDSVARQRYVPSTARARSELGLVQTIGLRSAILRTLRWHEACISMASSEQRGRPNS